MDVPKPIDEPELDSWGLIFGLKADEIYWFDSDYAMIGFLYLGAVTHHKVDDSDAQFLVDMVLQSRLALGITAFQKGGKTDFRAEVDEVNQLLSSRKLIWWGQLNDLAYGSDPLAQQLRQDFLENESPNPSPAAFQADRFIEWLEELNETSFWPYDRAYSSPAPLADLDDSEQHGSEADDDPDEVPWHLPSQQGQTLARSAEGTWMRGNS